jgi:hypothetical protein
MRRLAATIVVLLAMLLSTASTATAQVSIGIQIGPPPPPRVVTVVPARPGPEFLWIDGYWVPSGKTYAWHDGYWTHAPAPGAVWVVPRYDGKLYYVGHWKDKSGKEIKENPGKGRARGKGHGG